MSDKKPFAVASKPGSSGSATAEKDHDAHDEEVATEQAKLAARKKAADKVTALLFDEQAHVYITHGMTWGWFKRPHASGGEDAQMSVTQLFDVAQNRHLPDFKTSIAIDRFPDCLTEADCERVYRVALRRKLLNAHGIKYIYLHKGNSLLSIPVKLAEQDV
jgi:hypothetical protein